MNRRTTPSVAAALLASLALAGCGKTADGGTAAGGTRPPVAVETAKASASVIEEAVEVVGSLTARSEADVKTEYTGTVAEVYVTQWVRVKAGTPLARLDTREADAAKQAASKTIDLMPQAVPAAKPPARSKPAPTRPPA